MGRCLGILCRQERTKSRAASEKPVEGRSGGSPSTMAWRIRIISVGAQAFVCQGFIRERGTTYTKLTKYVVVCLGWVGIPTHGALDDAETEGPDIALDAVRTTTGIGARLGNASTGYPFGSHVGLAANIGLGDGSNEITADAKVTDLDLAFAIDKDVGRFDISMDDIVFVFE